MAKTLVIDANMLVLLAVGLADPDYIRKHKRLYPTYRAEHFELPLEFVTRERVLATTTHALTEASNLLRQCSDPMRTEIMLALRDLIGRCGESTPAARRVCALAEFPRLGLTDTAFVTLRADKFKVLSADLDLIVALQNRNVEVVNFQNILFD